MDASIKATVIKIDNKAGNDPISTLSRNVISRRIAWARAVCGRIHKTS